MGKLAVLAMVGFCLASAAGVYVLAIQEPRQTMQRADETVEGTVVATEVVANPGPDETSYVPKVTYRYSYDGRTYTSHNVHPTRDSYSMRPKAEAVLERYSAGDTVTVSIVPEDPSTSFLEKRPVPLHFWGVLVGFVALALLGAFAFVDEVLGLGYVNVR